jgi:hypothetical protein
MRSTVVWGQSVSPPLAVFTVILGLVITRVPRCDRGKYHNDQVAI